MGGNVYDYSSSSYLATKAVEYADKSYREIFKQRTMNDMLDPKKVKHRESAPSENHPNPTPISVFLDGSGSMGILAEKIAKSGLKSIYDNLVQGHLVQSPHILFGVYGDSHQSDRAPLQVTEFESDHTIVNYIEKLYIEGGGGSNSYESDALPLLFAKHKFKLHKQCRKGYIFTIGDEYHQPRLDFRDYDAIGVNISDMTVQERSISTKDLYNSLKNDFHIFHLIVKEGNFCRVRGYDRVYDNWCEVYDKDHVLPLVDVDCIGEVISAIIAIDQGIDRQTITSSFGHKAKEAVDSLFV